MKFEKFKVFLRMIFRIIRGLKFDLLDSYPFGVDNLEDYFSLISDLRPSIRRSMRIFLFYEFDEFGEENDVGEVKQIR